MYIYIYIYIECVLKCMPYLATTCSNSVSEMELQEELRLWLKTACSGECVVQLRLQKQWAFSVSLSSKISHTVCHATRIRARSQKIA